MIQRHILLGIVPLVLGLSACVSPSPYGGAPVVDRSVNRVPQRPPPPPAPPVEVNTLDRPAPLIPQQQIGPMVPNDPYRNAPPPAALPPVATAPAPEPAAPTAPEPVATAPTPEPVVSPAPQQSDNQAVATLLNDAADFVGQGELDRAGAALERALRIEPRNAGIWHDLAQIRLHQRNYQQVESLASKSNSLAGSDRDLQARNWELIAFARRAVNDTAGADEADAQASTLR